MLWLFISIVIIFVFSLNYETIINHAIDFCRGRFEWRKKCIVSSSFTKILESPIFGYGGTTCWFRLEATLMPETFLTLGLQGVVYSLFIFKMNL